MWKGKTIFFVLALAGLAADLGSKAWIFDVLSCGTRPHAEIVLIEGFFRLKCVRNPGGMWGLGADYTAFLVVVRAVLSVGIVLYVAFLPPTRRLSIWALGLILAGALGNLYDSLGQGSVRDFLDFTIPVIDYPWPTFNMADMMICTGFGLLVLELVRERHAPAQERASTTEGSH